MKLISEALLCARTQTALDIAEPSPLQPSAVVSCLLMSAPSTGSLPMSPIEICFKASLLLSIALMAVPALTAQTLEHRPPSVPESLPPATTSSNASVALTPIRPTLPEGTNLQVEIIRHYPMKAGESIEGRLLFRCLPMASWLSRRTLKSRGGLSPCSRTRRPGGTQGFEGISLHSMWPMFSSTN